MRAREPVDILISSLERIEPLEQTDLDELHGLSLRRKRFDAGEDIVQAGTHPTESCFVVSGFAARAQHLLDGGRQLDQIHIAGDFVDLHSLHLEIMDHSVVSLGPCEVAYVPHHDLISVMSKFPRLTWLLWQLTILDSAVARMWMSCLGRRRADAALAHLVCELFVRLERAGGTDDGCFHFPARQVDLADMLGVTTVHVNRTIAQLRSQKLIEWTRQVFCVMNFEKLAKLADFDSSYLDPGRPVPVQFLRNPAH